MEGASREQEGLRLGCPACGGGLQYDIKTEGMRCAQCGKQYAMADIQDPSPKEKHSDGMMETMEYHCPQCGAALYAYENAGVSRCVFCGSDVVLEERLSRIRKPDLILPFRITREECEEIYRKRVRRALFAPKEMLAEDTVHGFQPVYIPFWLYHGENHDKSVASNTEVTHSGNKTITSDYSYELKITVNYDYIYYDASTAFDDETAMRLSMKGRDARDFHPGYLCGCYAEAPDVEPDIYQEVIVGQANARLVQDLRRRKYSCRSDHFRRDMPTQKKLVMMPVWMMADRQEGGKVLYTAINGRTGEIVCDTPVGKGRFALLAGVLAVLFFALLFLLDSSVMIRSRLLAGICGMLTAFAAWMIAPETEKMILRKKGEEDPTRVAVRDAKARILPGKTPKARLKDLPFAERKPYGLIALGIFAAAAVVYTILAYFITRRARAPHVAFVSSFMDDGALFPVFMTVVSGVMLYYMHSLLSLNAGGKMDYLLLCFAEFLAAAGMLFVNSDYVNYGISIAFLILTSVMMWVRFRHHNQYVTRPVPFFGKEEEQA